MKQVEEEATKQSRPVRRRGRGREGGSNSQFSEETTTSKETEEEEDGQGTTIMATASVGLSVGGRGWWHAYTEGGSREKCWESLLLSLFHKSARAKETFASSPFRLDQNSTTKNKAFFPETLID